jgi:hypothetical protein
VLDFDSDFEASNDEPANVSVNEVNSITSKADVRIQVSAKHLMLASPVFKKTLTDKWKEGSTFVGTGSVEITTESWDVEAFFMLLEFSIASTTNCQRGRASSFLLRLLFSQSTPKG